MATNPTDTATPEAPPARHTRLLVAIVGAALLAVTAVVVIFAIGIRHVPDFPTVDEQPAPPVTGRLAYLTWEPEGDDAPYGGPCLYVQDIGGERRTLSCGEQSVIEGGPGWAAYPAYPEWFGWDDEGHLLLAEYTGGIESKVELITIDVDTGEELSRETISGNTPRPDLTLRDDGARVGTTWSEDGWAEVWVREPGEPQRTLYRVQGPDGYSFWSAQWSPQGDYVLVQDSERRTVVVAVTGDPAPRELLRNADQVAWYQPE